MKYLPLILLAAALYLLTRKKSIVTDQGTFRLVRSQGSPDETGAFDIELWEKAGEPGSMYQRLLSGRFVPLDPGGIDVSGWRVGAVPWFN